jgi:acyl-CoA thioesterase FadM
VLHELYHAQDASLIARARVVGVWLGSNRMMARLPPAYREAVSAQLAHHPEPSADHGDPADDVPAAIASVSGDAMRSFFAPPRVVFTPLSVAVDAPAAPPAQVAFTHEISVPPRDLDIFSHVNAATWLAYADDARARAAESSALDPLVARGYCVRAALFYNREAALDDRLRVELAALEHPISERHALGAWFYRAGDPQPRCTLRLDLAPGARIITEPAAPTRGA